MNPTRFKLSLFVGFALLCSSAACADTAVVAFPQGDVTLITGHSYSETFALSGSNNVESTWNLDYVLVDPVPVELYASVNGVSVGTLDLDMSGETDATFTYAPIAAESGKYTLDITAQNEDGVDVLVLGEGQSTVALVLTPELDVDHPAAGIVFCLGLLACVGARRREP